jgi:hypothetical protein
MASSNVLRVNTVEEQTGYRNAVAQILLDIQRETGATHIEIAEAVDVSLGTISNAANKKTDLNATYLSRLGRKYGAHFLDPYLALFGARSVPLDRGSIRDILPLIQRAGLKIAEARDKDGPGGERELHTEKLGYLPELKRLQAEMAKLVCEIEALAA